MQPQVVKNKKLDYVEKLVLKLKKLLSFLKKISTKFVLVVLKSNNDEPFIIFPILSYTQAEERVRTSLKSFDLNKK